MRPLAEGELTIGVTEEAAFGPLVLSWRGVSSDPEVRRYLAPFLQEALAEARRGGRVLELRFAGLEYCNSATISALTELMRQSVAAGARLVCVFDLGRRWQRLAHGALRIFQAGGTVELKAVGP